MRWVRKKGMQANFDVAAVPSPGGRRSGWGGRCRRTSADPHWKPALAMGV